MLAEIYWIEGATEAKIAIMPRPRGGDWLPDEIKSLRDQGVDVLVSLLTPDEVQELDLSDEPQLCGEYDIDYHSFPIPDRQPPRSWIEIDQFMDKLYTESEAGKGIAVHCRMGLGRSAIITAALLIRGGTSADSALACIAEARGQRVPDTDEQVAWLRTFARQKEGL